MGEAAGKVTGWEERPERLDLEADETIANDPEVVALVDEIEVTRADLAGTVEEIGDRLNPANIVADAKETVREATVGKVEQMANNATDMVSNAGQTAQQAGAGIVDTVRRNPIPAAMAAIGIGMLVRSARESSSPWTYRDSGRPSRYGAWDTSMMGGRQPSMGDRMGQVGESAGQAVSEVQQRAGEVAEQVGQRVGDVGQTVGDTMSRVPWQAESMARRVGDDVGRMFDSNPLAVGAIAVAVGTAVGLALPVTNVERQVLGQPGSQLLERAESAASDALGQAEDKARDAERQAQREDMQARSH